MNFKYKLLQQEDGYKIVEFQHSFYNGLKKTLAKQSNEYFKMLNPADKVKKLFTVIPSQYNHENAKTAMVMQSTIENEAIGFIIDETDNNVVFDRVSTTINNKSNEFCAIRMGDTNIIICPDDINAVKKLSKIIDAEIIKYNTDKAIPRNKDFVLLDISYSEQCYIQDEIKDRLIELMEEGIEIDEDITVLTQLDLCKVVVKKKKMQDVQRLFELLNVSAFILNNAFYVQKLDQKMVEEYVPKMFSGEIRLKDKAYLYNEEEETSIAIEPKQQEKHIFKYKDIGEVIKSKTDKNVQNPNIEQHDLDEIKK